MKLFVSYPSDERDLAERLRLALEAEGHDVFTDRAELRAGEAYHDKLRQAIDDADAAVFLLTPRAVAPGSYALSELELAQRRWRRPAGHVLPVVVQPTPVADIPPYLKAVTLLQPRGDVVAETVAAVARMRAPAGARRWRWIAAVAGALALAAAGGAWQWRVQERRTIEAAQAQAQAQAQRQLAAQLDAAAALCRSGSHVGAWDALQPLAAANPGSPAAQPALQDCGMRWLREARVTVGKQTFGQIVDRVQPVLAAGLAGAEPARRADLLAHIGYGDFLRARDGVSAPDPMPQYEAALAGDAGNVYANSLRAHLLVWRRPEVDENVRRHFDAALRSGRERPWVRSMQWAAAARSGTTYLYGLELADELRRGGEPLGDAERNWLWNSLVERLVNADDRQVILAALPADAMLATFEWAFPRPAPEEPRTPKWRFVHALLRLDTGARDDAMTELSTLKRELVAANRYRNIVAAIDVVLAPPKPVRR